MKQFFYAILFLLFFFTILFFPSETLVGATNGLLLWFQIVIPSLLPFFILTNLLIQTNSISLIVKFLAPFLTRVFSVSADGSFAILAGFLCGYPIGAKVTADLVKQKRISVREGNYLLSFCNNTSPAFISNFVVLQKLKDPSLLFASLCILFLSPILCSVLFRLYYKGFSNHIQTQTKSIQFHFQMLDDCIMNAFESITKIGGYIILFSILFILGKNTPFHILLPSLEITNGITYLTNSSLRFTWSYTSIMALSSFGGLCSIAQTYSVIQGSDLSIFAYITEKLITALVTSFLAFAYVKIILR